MRSVRIGWLLPLTGVWLALDPLGGLFVALTGAVAIRWASTRSAMPAEHLTSVAQVVLPLFAAAMLLVPAAGSVTTFLFAWELMAIASLVLVLSDHDRPAVRSAGLLYAVMTQLGFVAILVGLMLLSAAGRRGPAHAIDSGARKRTHRGVFAHHCGLRLEGGTAAAACLAARAPIRRRRVRCRR